MLVIGIRAARDVGNDLRITPFLLASTSQAQGFYLYSFAFALTIKITSIHFNLSVKKLHGFLAQVRKQ